VERDIKLLTDLDKPNLAKYVGLYLTQFLLLLQLPQKMKLSSKVVKRDSNIILINYSKSLTQSVEALPILARLVSFKFYKCKIHFSHLINITNFFEISEKVNPEN